jgi:hypothetical protein
MNFIISQLAVLRSSKKNLRAANNGVTNLVNTFKWRLRNSWSPFLNLVPIYKGEGHYDLGKLVLLLSPDTVTLGDACVVVVCVCVCLSVTTKSTACTYMPTYYVSTRYTDV